MFDFGARRPWPIYATLKYLSDTFFDTCNDIRNGISHDKDDPDGTKSSQVHCGPRPHGFTRGHALLWGLALQESAWPDTFDAFFCHLFKTKVQNA